MPQLLPISNLQHAIDLKHGREQLLYEIENIKNTESSYLGVTFHGRYQDEKILAIVRGPIIEKLQNEVWRIEEKLKQMGIDSHA